MSVRKNLKPRQLSDFPERVRAIILEEAEAAKVHPRDILSASRCKPFPEVRFRIWKRQRDLINGYGEKCSLPHIGRMWGADHTTIRHGILKIEELEAA